MEFTVGTILEGKVKSITNFGAFISLPENKTGLVHISEEGQDVKVMVLSTENGKLNLSIKRLEQKPEAAPRSTPRPAPSQGQPRFSRPAPVPPAAPKTADQLFEEKLKAFMSESDSKISSIKMYSDHRTKSRRR